MTGYELLFIGLLAALIFTAATGYYPGGLIVPGYLALFVNQPYRLAGTIIAAIITVIIFNVASRHLLLFGKRRFVFMLLLGSLSAVIISRFAPALFPGTIDYRVIGLVIPGLIANSYSRQGVVITTASMSIVTAATWFAGIVYYQIF